MPQVSFDPRTGHMLVDGRPVEVSSTNPGYAATPMSRQGLYVANGGRSWVDLNSQRDEAGQLQASAFTNLSSEQLQRLGNRVVVGQGIGGPGEAINWEQVEYDPELGFITDPANVKPPEDSAVDRLVGNAIRVGAVALPAAMMAGFIPGIEGLGAAPTSAAGTIPINPATPLTEGVPAWATQPGGWEAALAGAGEAGGGAGGAVTSAAWAPNEGGAFNFGPGNEGLGATLAGSTPVGEGLTGISWVDSLIEGLPSFETIMGRLPAALTALRAGATPSRQGGGGGGGLGLGGGGGGGGGGYGARPVTSERNPYATLLPPAQVKTLSDFLNPPGR